MILPTGAITFANLNQALGVASTSALALGSNQGRGLAGKFSGAVSLNDCRGKEIITATLTAAQITAFKVGYDVNGVPSGSMSSVTPGAGSFTVIELRTHSSDGTLFMNVFGSSYGFNNAGEGADITILPSGGGVYTFARSAATIFQNNCAWVTAFRFVAGNSYTVIISADSSPN